MLHFLLKLIRPPCNKDTAKPPDKDPPADPSGRCSGAGDSLHTRLLGSAGQYTKPNKHIRHINVHNQHSLLLLCFYYYYFSWEEDKS